MYRAKQLIHWERAEKESLTGKNIVIAYLDSGVTEHPDLQGKILAFKDFVYNRNKVYDDTGHGTHVCGIASGTGLKSNGIYSGIAPDAAIVMAKVLNDRAEGSSAHLLEAIDWILELKKKIPIRILNISIGMKHDISNTKEKKMIAAVEKAWDAGLTVVCATGNNGPVDMTLSPMAMSSKVITVGCHDKGYVSKDGYRCEDYSGRGPSRYDIRKPDVVAPGTDIMSCNYLFSRYNKRNSQAYIRKSGTSMSTPIVSGTIALLMEREKTIQNQEIKRKIVYTAEDLHEIWTKQGWGMINIDKLLQSVY